MRSYRGNGSTSKSSNASSQCSTPVEAVSKWKIPHYYRKSGSFTGNGSSESSFNPNSKSDCAPSGSNINIMTTPKHVQLDGGGKRSSKSKPKKGEMVFVNYTVKDTKAAELPSTKKKSSKSRMLKIFSAVHHSGGQNQTGEVVAPLDTASLASNYHNGSDPAIQSQSSVSTPSSQATKRSYSSFLKCGGIGSASTITSPTISPPEQAASSFAASSATERRPGLGRSLSSNVSLINNNGKASLTLGTSCSEASLPIRHSPSRDRSNPYLNSHLDHHHMEQLNEYHGYPATTRPHSNSMHSSVSPRPGDENDASIAFSKLFTRKRANTGGSMSSLVSSTSNNVPSLQRNVSTNSISSLANKYSPIRTGSPAKTNSLRRSNSNRFSRDFSSLHSSSNYAVDLTAGMDTYLDAQAKQRHSQKKKQESISDLRGPSTVSSLSSASTPCFFDNGQSNTVSGHERQNSIMFSLDRESSLENEILEEPEEASYSPNEASAIKGIPKTTLEVADERDSDIASLQNTSRSSVTMFSSLVNSHSTLDSALPLGKDLDQKSFHSSAFQNTGIDLQFKEQHPSINYQESQSDDFLNLYMELDLGSRAEFMASQQGKIAPFESDGSFSNLPFQGDASTLHSVMHASPATVTNTTNNNIRTELAEDNSRNEQVPYTNFSHRIMHDIDQIAHSINNGEGAESLTNDWDHSQF
ncbi:LANO_0C05666g1_1 [Lachancea nothofagi CBS 11611]|uniref:LANO_0C05666g1_1 n=1 Tax=Lachancea nothofagi CBS 11611 TaxID=1266666 RepID=A0A1G4J7Q8_9SACH|nr:LANO_0C05666g1_1 [Lachancea nothofagi CBS 11611]